MDKGERGDGRFLTYLVKGEGMKVETVLKKQFSLTAAQIRSLKFKNPGIAVNGRKARVNEYLKPGDLLKVCLSDGRASAHLEALQEPFPILYEDDDLLAAAKPSGILVHPSGIHYQDTLSNQVAAYYRKKRENALVRPVGRLDKDTSGIVLFAKNQVSAARLQEGEGKIRKEYFCLAKGRFLEKEGVVESPILRSASRELRMEIHPGGKYALTQYQVLREFEDASFLKVEIFTGRTHQIRLHLASLGHPLLGDPLYGDGGGGFKRSALHAGKVSFAHPISGERIELSMALPKDFQSFLKSK